MDLAFVVTTLGRIDPLSKLVESMVVRLTADDQVVIVAQQNRDAVEAAIMPLRSTPATVTVLSSALGASLGRNVGVAALRPNDDPLLVFPNDTTWFPEHSIEALREIPPTVRLAAATIVDEHGPKFVLPTAGTPLDRRSVWTVIEMGLLMRRRLFTELGGFDETLGTGANTPWQAGEATDLLLRYLAHHPDGDIEWLPSAVRFGGVGATASLSAAERRRKLRGYGRGLGRLVSRWKYPAMWRGAFVAAGLLVGVRHRPNFTVLDGWWGMLGRLEGVTGRTLGATQLRAVSR